MLSRLNQLCANNIWYQSLFKYLRTQIMKMMIQVLGQWYCLVVISTMVISRLICWVAEKWWIEITTSFFVISNDVKLLGVNNQVTQKFAWKNPVRWCRLRCQILYCLLTNQKRVKNLERRIFRTPEWISCHLVTIIFSCFLSLIHNFTSLILNCPWRKLKLTLIDVPQFTSNINART